MEQQTQSEQQEKKKGRPKKYATEEEALAAHAEQMRQSRERARDRTRPYEPFDWLDGWTEKYPDQHEDLMDFVHQTEHTIAAELGSSLCGIPEEYTVRSVLICVYATRQKDPSVWLRKVSGGETVASGALFIDVIAEDIIAQAHRTNLERSGAYSKLYRELLQRLDEMFGANNDDSSRAVKQERAGTFTLPNPEPKQNENKKAKPEMTPVVPAPAAPAPVVNVPVAFQELNRNLDQAARDFLHGIK